MRLPGTFNIGYDNHLLPIHAIAAARREHRLSEASADIPLKKKSSDPKLKADGGKDDKDTKAAKAAESDGFTAKEDKKLLKLKTEENKSWKDIAAALSKDVGAVKERWQKIRPDKQEKQDGDKPAGEAKKEEKQEANKKEKRSDHKKGVMHLGEDDDIILEPDENFNFDEVNLY
jgi:hypothetical protein